MNIKKLKEKKRITFRSSNGQFMNAEFIGDLNVFVIINQRPKNIIIKDVYYVPKATAHLLSLTKIIHEEDKVIILNNNSCIIKNKFTNNVILESFATNGLLKATFYPNNNVNDNYRTNILYLNENNLIHRRLTHCNHEKIRLIAKNNLISKLNVSNNNNKDICEVCIRSKKNKK